MVLRVHDDVFGKQRSSRDLVGNCVDQHNLVEEPRVNLRSVEGLFDRGAFAQGLLNRDDSTIRGNLRDLEKLVNGTGAPVNPVVVK